MAARKPTKAEVKKAHSVLARAKKTTRKAPKKKPAKRGKRKQTAKQRAASLRNLKKARKAR